MNLSTAERDTLEKRFGRFGVANRSAIVDRLNAEGDNKCEDCCLVPRCPSCGPCPEHDNAGTIKEME